MTDTKTLAKRKPNELRELIEGSEFRAQLAKALPTAMSPERFVRITVTSTMRNPKLLQCTRDTFFRCLLDLSALGLEPDGRQAHLIPRKNKTGGMDCTLIVDYKGLKELLYRNGDIIDEHSAVVGDLDHFEYEFGSNKHLTHRPNTRERGKIYCAYSFVTLPRGGTNFEVLSIDEIEAIRKRSAAGDSGPWVTDWAEMAKKSVFKRLAKGLPLSPRTRDAIEVDNSYEVPEPASVTTTRASVGGRREVSSQSLSDPVPENGEEPEKAAEEPEEAPGPPQMAPETPASPQEPVSPVPGPDKPPGPLTRLRGLLKESGFRSEELLRLLKSVRLINQNVGDLSHVPAKALEEVLGDWENCVKRLELERQTKSEDFPV
jgi:recombination protein RecT